jgi:hypothetical protein
VIGVLNALVTIVFGLITRIPYFVQCNFFVLFLQFSTFSMSLISLAFFFSTFISTSKAACKIKFKNKSDYRIWNICIKLHFKFIFN